MVFFLSVYSKNVNALKFLKKYIVEQDYYIVFAEDIFYVKLF